MNYFDWIGKWSEYTPNKVAVATTDENCSYTFNELHVLASKVEDFLKTEYAVKKGDRLPVLAEHSPQFLILFLAAQRLGAILVPLNYRASPSELEYCIRDLDPKLILIDVELFRSKLEKLQKKVELPVITLQSSSQRRKRFSMNSGNLISNQIRLSLYSILPELLESPKEYYIPTGCFSGTASIHRCSWRSPPEIIH